MAVALLIRMGLRGTNASPLRLPLLGPILQDLGELPYLQTLRGLYAAGIPLLQAHPQAIKTVPVATMQKDLERADARLQEGRPLAEALDASQALSRETRQILATGETSGDLEGALQRAAIRRDQTLRSRAQRGARVLAGTIYVLAVGVATYVIFSFYTGYYGQLKGILGR